MPKESADKSVPFNPERDIPSLKEKAFFVTGGTAGIGRQTVLQLARHFPAQIVFTGRNAAAAASLTAEVSALAPEVATTFVQMDLSSLRSVRAAVRQAAASLPPRLDVLICNAGVMIPSPPGTVGVDGFETHFATNHLGHAMLIRLLLPSMASSPDARVVILTSVAWRAHPSDMISYAHLRDRSGRYASFMGKWRAYGQSKFANVLYASELARRAPQVVAVSAHPGVVGTSLIGDLAWFDRWFIIVGAKLEGFRMLTPEEGAHNQLWLATGAKRTDLVNGAFYMPVGVMSNDWFSDKERDPEVAKKLWEWTEETLDQYM